MENMGEDKAPQASLVHAGLTAEIVESRKRGDRSVGQVARDFDLTETSVRESVRQAERDAGTWQDSRLTTDERRELSGGCAVPPALDGSVSHP